jgi:hypothetical protein
MGDDAAPLCKGSTPEDTHQLELKQRAERDFGGRGAAGTSLAFLFPDRTFAQYVGVKLLLLLGGELTDSSESRNELPLDVIKIQISSDAGCDK